MTNDQSESIGAALPGPAIVTSSPTGWPSGTMRGLRTNRPCSMPLTTTVPLAKNGYTDQAPLYAGASSAGIDVEEPDLAQDSSGDIARVEYAQAAAIVRLVDEISTDIEVVVDRLGGAVVQAGEHGCVEIRHVPDPRSRRVPEGELVALVVYQEEPLVPGEPSLVRVRAASVAGPRQLNLFERVRGVDHRQRVFVGVETDLAVAIDRVGSRVDHALRFVCVAVEAEAPGCPRGRGRADVDDVQTAFTRACADSICEAQCGCSSQACASTRNPRSGQSLRRSPEETSRSRSCVRSKTCMPWLAASLTMNA